MANIKSKFLLLEAKSDCMKKLVSIVFSIFYLTLTIGLAVNVHYCQGALESVDLYAANDSCCCGDTGPDQSCCQDEAQFLKLDNELRLVSSPRLDMQPLVLSLLPAEETDQALTTAPAPTHSRALTPTPPLEQPAWLLFCSLIYYG
ncbi:HYC_CC_PP family protein [Sunxiuqinia rutila]|uniref:HYC_CC_PP family protein n=1 Tax=Sunxiuqinia rutila TaxID=1397841 RepID=UPI003D36EE3A